MYGALKSGDYRPRLLDTRISEDIELFGAVCIQGPKYCGKTWTGRSFANSEICIMDPAGGFQNREMAELSPSLALEGDSPRLVDEWQEVPALWDAVRDEVDRTNKKRTFILTGSAVPRNHKPRHSGVGRIEKLRMRPMSLQESGDSTAAVSLSRLFEGEAPTVKAPETSLELIASLIVRGGWPASIGAPDRLAQRMPRNYVDTVAEDDLSRVDEVKRDPAKVRRLLHSLSRTMEQATTTKTLIRDMTADAASAPLSSETVDDYLGALKKIFILEEIPGWSPNLRSPARINKKPKYHFIDPSLPAAVLGATCKALVADLRTFGFLFESLCVRDLLIYAQALEANVFYYRDRDGLEADAVIEMPDGSWAGIEIKLGHNQADEAAASLLRVKNKILGAGGKEPVFLAVVEGLGSFAGKRDDGVLVVPIRTLGA
ncbi:ATP-binding protein [Arabiibacter massiliensis]|uniref:ATP-binding protein n=1 Tax=Arabiibacter massiliensis TaxID=1870985 RepID=UPI00155AC3E3|nr:DUF4143 domain-containing protein [Arabiibacter massiliensis]